jgi:CO/xanthine dehydrogenase FAD-binding subunit
MKPAAFDMLRPRTLPEALAALADRADDAKVIAGGQSLVPAMNFRLATPSLLIDLNTVDGLAGIRRGGDRLRIGAMTRQRELLKSSLVASHAPLLAKAVPHIGHVQTRSRGTIGGSLAHADPSAELPLVMVALDAELTLARRGSERTVPARAFFTGAMTTDLKADEILTEIALPAAPAGTRSTFCELARRHGDFAIVAVAVQYAPPDLTVAVGGLEAVPRYCAHLVQALRQRKVDRASLRTAIAAALAGAQPLDDLQAGAEYRRHLAAVLLEDAVAEVLAW